MSNDGKSKPGAGQQPAPEKKKDELDQAALDKVSGGGGGTLTPKPTVAPP